jgi:tetratricopeptide (TPR) repeat protein
MRRISIPAFFAIGLSVFANSAFSFEDAKADEEKVVLAELFTGATCPPCVAADLGFDLILANQPHSKVVVLEYHLSIPASDPMATKETAARARYYMRRRQSTPQSFYDGGNVLAGAPSADMGEEYYGKAMGRVKAATEKTLELRLSARLTWQDAGAHVEVIISPLVKLESQDLRLHLVIYEDEVDFKGSNGISTHRCVVRTMVEGPDGLPISLMDEHTTLSRPIDGSIFENKNMGLVAFVQDRRSRRILQAQAVVFKAGKADMADYYNHAVASAKEGKYDEAITLFERAREIDPESLMVRRSLGMAFAMKGRMNEAITEWEAALGLAPDDADIHLYLSEAYEKTGQIESAIAHLERFLALAPNHQHAAAASAKLRSLREHK